MKRPFTARFQIFQGEQTRSGWDQVTVRNLSSSGIAFNYTKKIELGTALSFIITLPATTVHCKGIVWRLDKPPPDTPGSRRIPVYGIIAHFVGMDRNDEEAIDRIANESFSEEEE